MNTRPSLRHGLPYGWWKSPRVWEAFTTTVILTLTFVGITGLILAWFLDWQPTW